MPYPAVSVIIPACNEEASLPFVLRDLPEVGLVIVVNNASDDRTAQCAREAGAVVVDEPRLGYGSACLAGLGYLERRIAAGLTAPEVIVFVDGDYSDHVDQLPLLVEPILAGEVEFVLGSRMLGPREPGAMPPQSVWGNRLACWLMRLLWRVSYTDLGPFRAIRYADLQRLDMRDVNFGWTVEMQIKAARAGLVVREVAVPYRRRIGQSKISGTLRGTLGAGGKILFTIARHGFSTGLRRETRHTTECRQSTPPPDTSTRSRRISPP